MTISSSSNLPDILDFTTRAALEAGERIASLREAGGVDVKFKSEKDIVTNADIQAEQIIIGHIKRRFPTHAFLTEESFPKLAGSDPNGPMWIIDPIDGTANYAHGLDHVAVSIAYASEGKVQVAVVHCPFLGQTFTATLGGGAHCNGTPIKTAVLSELSHAIIATGFPGWRQEVESMVAQAKAILTVCRDIRRFGAAAIDVCYVACGKLDGYWESVKPWDIAAAGLIAREAGALTGHYKQMAKPVSGPACPNDWNGDNYLVAGPALFTKLQGLLETV